MKEYIYTVYRGRIEKHTIVRETGTGWTVLANWGPSGQTEHLKAFPYKPLYGFNFDNRYTETILERAAEICERFQESLKCIIRDSESDVMNLHKFK